MGAAENDRKHVAYVCGSHGISTPWPTKDQLTNLRMLLEDGSLQRRIKNIQANDLDTQQTWCDSNSNISITDPGVHIQFEIFVV